MAVRFRSPVRICATDERASARRERRDRQRCRAQITKLDPREFHALAVQHGEIGEGYCDDLAAKLKAAAVRFDAARSLRCLRRSRIDRKRRAKKEILRDLFSRCSHPREAAYLAKIIFSDLRTGVREGVLHDAIAAGVRQRSRRRSSAPAARRRPRRSRGARQARSAARPRSSRCSTRSSSCSRRRRKPPSDAAEAMDGRTYFAEDKLDGIRAQVHKSGRPHRDLHAARWIAPTKAFPTSSQRSARFPASFCSTARSSRIATAQCCRSRTSRNDSAERC